MDRLRGAIHTASSRLGRSDPTPAATENVSPQSTVNTVRQTPTEAPLSSQPQALHAESNTGIGRLPLAGDSHLYLPSIRILRNRHDDSRPGANIGSVHDYAESPRKSGHTASGRQETWWTKTRQTLGFGHGGEDSEHSERDYDADMMVDALDTVGTCPISMALFQTFSYSRVSSDPEVQTLVSLTNVQNSLFLPNLGKFVNRRPTFSLTSLLQDVEQKLKPGEKERPAQERPTKVARPAPVYRAPTGGTITSKLSDSRYAVLPEGASLSGWTHQDRLELNDHVRHMLHSRRSKFKRSMKGFLQYVRQRQSA